MGGARSNNLQVEMASTPTTLYHLREDAKAAAKAAAEASKLDQVKEVHELPVSQTSIYHEGKLVQDPVDRASNIDPTKASMNELLQWAVANSDPEDLKKRAEAGEQLPEVDKEIRDLLLGGDSDAVRMRKCVNQVNDRSADEDKQLDALEELEFYVETIDNAIDLPKVGGFEMILGVMRDLPSADVVASALSVFGVCVQNNEVMQQQAADAGFVTELLRLLQLESMPQVQKKSATALSALLRAHGPSTQLFLDEGGVAVVMKVIVSAGKNAASPQQQLTQRLWFMLTRLTIENVEIVRALVDATFMHTALDTLRQDPSTAEAAQQHVLELVTTLLESKEHATRSRVLLEEADVRSSLNSLKATLKDKPATDEEDYTQLLSSVQQLLTLLK